MGLTCQMYLNARGDRDHVEVSLPVPRGFSEPSNLPVVRNLGAGGVLAARCKGWGGAGREGEASTAGSDESLLGGTVVSIVHCTLI